MEPKSSPIVPDAKPAIAVEEQRYRRSFYAALGQNWLLTAEPGDKGPLGYRLVHVRTGAKGLGHGPQGPVTLDEIDAFLNDAIAA
jgi:hypothetical protein